MKITKKVVYKATFSIEYFESAEGGMDWDTFGEAVSTLEEAIHLLELAQISNKGRDWKIVCNVDRQVTKGGK
jgi:hypothetical protein